MARGGEGRTRRPQSSDADRLVDAERKIMLICMNSLQLSFPCLLSSAAHIIVTFATERETYTNTQTSSGGPGKDDANCFCKIINLKLVEDALHCDDLVSGTIMVGERAITVADNETAMNWTQWAQRGREID